MGFHGNGELGGFDIGHTLGRGCLGEASVEKRMM